MVLCLLSRDSHGDTTKLNHEETVRGPEIAICHFPPKSEILLWGEYKTRLVDPHAGGLTKISSKLSLFPGEMAISGPRTVSS